MPAKSSLDFPEFVQAFAALGPGDLSVNEAAAAQPGSTMLTAIGSPNDLLWSRMEAEGGVRIVPLDTPISGTRAFQFSDGGAQAIAAAFRVLLARKVGRAPIPDADSDAFMAQPVALRARLIAERKKFSDGIAHLETVRPETAEREALKAELLSGARNHARALDVAIGAINDAIAAGPNPFGFGFVERARAVLESGGRAISAINEKHSRERRAQ